MNKIKKILTWIGVIATSCVTAQDKLLTMQDAVLGMSGNLAIKNLKQLKWMGSDEIYVQAINNENIKAYMATDPVTQKADTVFTLSQINQAISANLSSLPGIEWLNQNEGIVQQKQQFYRIKNEGGQVIATPLFTVPAEAANLSWTEDHQSLAYTYNYNLYVQYQAKQLQITNNGNKNLLYGTSVHRDEFGIDKGIFWSPKNHAIAFYCMDQSMVADYPIINWSTTPATVNQVKYPFAGQTSHQVTLGVYHIATGKTIYLKTGLPADQYLTSVTWSPDEKIIYVGILNREQNYLRLNQYDAKSGDFIKTILSEKNDRYVEPQHPLYFPTDDPTHFVWWSQRSGYWHLYYYHTSGQLIKQLTKGNWLVNEIIGYKPSSQEILYTSTAGSALQKNIYSVSLKTGKSEQINEVEGTHTALASHRGNYLIDIFTNESTPRKIDIVDVNSGSAVHLLDAPNPLQDYAMPTVELKELTADDGTTLYAKMIYPLHFDASKKYPVIVYLYNGPHVQLNKDVFPFSGNLWYDYMAQRGYIVFVLDGRGSANRGFEFESAIHRQLGTMEMEDQMVGINYLQSLPYVDAQRMGIHGWSFGGFMTTSFMLRHPDIFKVGVAGGPVLDWSMYEVMYTERYMDTPQENKDGYAANELISKIKNLKGKLMLIHGTDDATVVWQHSINMIKQAVTDQVQVDYFVYPGYEHNVRGKDRVHLMQKISDYFDLYLQPMQP